MFVQFCFILFSFINFFFSPFPSSSLLPLFPDPFPVSSIRLEHEGITREKLARVAALLGHVEESDTVYRVASQLGLKGSIDTCLASPAAPYLKDTVFVQGCTTAL